MKTILYFILATGLLISCKNTAENQNTSEQEEEVEKITLSMDNPFDLENSSFKLEPISHASMIIDWEGTIVYVDPVGGGELYENKSTPQLILITDIHGDHLNVETLEAIVSPTSTIMAPRAVADKLPEGLLSKTQIINNGEIKEFKNFQIEAIPMYNLREEALKFHEKGRGNGYVIELKDERVYISGDTEDIPEMRNLKHIDRAFICMNLPYTMPVDKAAEAVLDFKPTMVYPYHYRGSEGPSDVDEFRKRVHEKNKNIAVVQLDWYPNEPY